MAASFVDKATIRVIGGKGGDGAVAFHREKYIAAGGPDGGDGGRGGDVIAVVDDHMSTLMDFRYKRKYVAGNGQNGSGNRCFGKDGESLTIRVPRGTLIRDKETGGILHDMSDDAPFVIARGGRGGWGNRHFATPTRQIPRFAKPGMPGQDREIVLELKLLADVGLVGFPNVGKSTLLSVVSKAHPKIANYHFTTLFPNLGVVYVSEGVSFVMADIPGIIEGASEGAGLGPTSCATSTAAVCSSTSWTLRAARGATPSRILRQSTLSCASTARRSPTAACSSWRTSATFWAMTVHRSSACASMSRRRATSFLRCPPRRIRARRS